MKKVYSHENLAILNSAKNLLEIDGIECFIKNEYHASGGHVGWESIPIELWVHDDQQAASAAAILANGFTATSESPEWECLHCGEKNDGSFETCWKCQKVASNT